MVREELHHPVKGLPRNQPPMRGLLYLHHPRRSHISPHPCESQSPPPCEAPLKPHVKTTATSPHCEGFFFFTTREGDHPEIYLHVKDHTQHHHPVKAHSRSTRERVHVSSPHREGIILSPPPVMGLFQFDYPAKRISRPLL